MPKYKPGEDVIVEFDGHEHQGEVLRQSRGYVMCQIIIDPLCDYGAQTPRLDPVSTVLVPEKNVRHAAHTAE